MGWVFVTTQSLWQAHVRLAIVPGPPPIPGVPLSQSISFLTSISFLVANMQLFVRAQELHTLEVTGQETVAQIKVRLGSAPRAPSSCVL